MKGYTYNINAIIYSFEFIPGDLENVLKNLSSKMPVE